MYCARHSDVDALWECLRCGVLHCGACVRQVGSDRHMMRACSHCDGLLRALQVEVAAPPDHTRRELTARVFSRLGLATVAAVGACSALSRMPMPLLNLLFGALYLAAGAGTYYNVVDHVARGRPGFPAPVEADSLPAQVLVARGLLALLAFFVGFGIWAGVRPGVEDLDELVAGRGVMAAVLTVVGTAWSFTGVLAMVNADSGLAAFWPPALARVAARVPREFARALAQALALTACCAGLRIAADSGLGALPMLAGFATGTVTAVSMFIQAAILGAHIRSNRFAYGIRR